LGDDDIFEAGASRVGEVLAKNMSGKKEEPSFNVFNHVLFPKHEILSKEEAAELLRKYKIKPYHLPKIKDTDPAVRALEAKPGDIIKITRKSPTAGEAVYYRFVVREK
jgi:DNA-directed RNA polymerase subunit H